MLRWLDHMHIKTKWKEMWRKTKQMLVDPQPLTLTNVAESVFSRFYVFPFTLMFCIIRSNFFDLYCTFADYNKRVLCTSLRQSKVSLKLIYYVLLLNTMYM